LSQEKQNLIEKQNAQIENLEKNYEEQSKKLLGNKSLIDGLQDSKFKLEKQVNTLRTDKKDLEETLSIYKEKEKTSQENLKRVEKAKERLKADIVTKTLEVMEKERNINKNNKERLLIVEELETKKNEIRLNLQEIQTLKRDISILHSVIHKNDIAKKIQETNLVKKDAQINELNEEVKKEQGKNYII